MSRRYAAALGLLAFAAILVRGVFVGGTLEATLAVATTYLYVFFILGGAAGWTAETIINDAIRSKLSAELVLRSQGDRLSVRARNVK